MRKTALVAGGAAVAIGLAGCGGAAGTTTFDSAQALVRTVSDQTSAAQTAAIGMQISFGDMRLTGQGAARFAGPDTALRMTMHVMGKTTQVRVVDQVVYLKLPEGVPSPVPSGASWLKIGAQMPGMSELFADLGQRADPSRVLRRIKEAGTITRTERTELGGQPVTHYWIQLDLGKLAGMYPALMAERMPEGMLRALRGQTLPMQLWLNSEQLPRKVTVDMSEMMQALFRSIRQQEGSPLAGMVDEFQRMFSDLSVTVTYSDWGEPVHISAPPADEVAPAPFPDHQFGSAEPGSLLGGPR